MPVLFLSYEPYCLFSLQRVSLILYRTFESAVMPNLISWASTSFEKSLNQPALPHIIIALNATDTAIDESQWDTKQSTETFFSDVQDAVLHTPMLQEFAQKWQALGSVVNTTKDLLECYYSSITVMRIPNKERYMLMHQQVGKLHNEIVTRCNQSHHMKAKVRMLPNSDDLQLYLQAGFDHFSQVKKPNITFDFIEQALRINPIPLNFGGNILKLAIAMKDDPSEPDPSEIFVDGLSLMVASCILLDTARHRRLGKQQISHELMIFSKLLWTFWAS